MEMQFIEPLKDGRKLTEYLETGSYHTVGILFGHGLGDCVMFKALLDKLRALYPTITFRMILQRGLDEEVVYDDADFFSSMEEVHSLSQYDLIAAINYSVESNPLLTKSELCCIEELGIEPTNDHNRIEKRFPNRLVAVHFNITCLPDLANPDYDVAKMIWDEILEAGWIPIESHFEHVFHNPVNKKFDFIDCTVRRCKPKVETLLGLLQNCGAFIGVVSGNFHCALATMPLERVALLQKHLLLERFTHHKIQVFNILDYQKDSVKNWLLTI